MLCDSLVARLVCSFQKTLHFTDGGTEARAGKSRGTLKARRVAQGNRVGTTGQIFTNKGTKIAPTFKTLQMVLGTFVKVPSRGKDKITTSNSIVC